LLADSAMLGSARSLIVLDPAPIVAREIHVSYNSEYVSLSEYCVDVDVAPAVKFKQSVVPFRN